MSWFLRFLFSLGERICSGQFGLVLEEEGVMERAGLLVV